MHSRRSRMPRTDADESHAYLVEKASLETVEDVIERLVAKPPGTPLPDDLLP